MNTFLFGMELLVLRGGFLFEKGPIDIYALCLICPLFRVFCSERCYFSFVSAVSLQRRAVRINYRLPLAFIVAQYLLLARYRAWARELSGPTPSLCVLVHLCVCGANGRIWEWGFGDWRIGGPVTVERGGGRVVTCDFTSRREKALFYSRAKPALSNCRRPLKYVWKLPDRSESIRTRVKAADFPCQTQFPNAADIQRITHTYYRSRKDNEFSIQDWSWYYFSQH